MTTRCWYCDQPIRPPVEIIGRWLAGRARIVHRTCLRVLGELDRELQQVDGDGGDAV